MMNKLLKIILAFVSIGTVLLLAMFLWIYADITRQCQKATKLYKGDCVTALTNLLKDEKKDFRSRNEAIWALGQLRDSRAYPTLKYYYTGNIPPREPLDKSISQYELKKALQLTEEGK